MQMVITSTQIWFAFWFALFMTVALHPKGFGLGKRAFGFTAIFACVVVCAVCDNNLQMLHH